MSASKKHIQTISDNRPPMVDDDGEVRELTAEDFARARPMKEMFPEIVEAFARMRGERGSQKSPVKERVGLRLDSEILAHFRATGAGWQSRINEILASHIAAQGKQK